MYGIITFFLSQYIFYSFTCGALLVTVHNAIYKGGDYDKEKLRIHQTIRNPTIQQRQLVEMEVLRFFLKSQFKTDVLEMFMEAE